MALKKTRRRKITPRWDHIDELWESFKKKDLTRAQFRKAYKRVMNPKRLSRDLTRAMLMLEIEKQMRGQIDRRLKRG